MHLTSYLNFIKILMQGRRNKRFFLGEANNFFYPSSNCYIAISLKFRFSKLLNFGETVVSSASPVPTPLLKGLVYILLYICDFQLIYTYLFIILVKMKNYSTFVPEMADQTSSHILLLQEKASLVHMVN